MPLIFKEKVEEDVMLGMWRIDEDINEFSHIALLPDSLKLEIAEFTSMQRKREVLAVRCLLNNIFGHYVGLNHNKDGKPYLENGYNISISHSKDVATVIVSSKRKVAIDVEYISQRVERIVSRLLREDENPQNLIEEILYWCTKETLYKFYSEEHLSLADMRVLSVEGDSINGIIIAENVQRCETLNVAYCIFDGYVLTYAVL